MRKAGDLIIRDKTSPRVRAGLKSSSVAPVITFHAGDTFTNAGSNTLKTRENEEKSSKNEEFVQNSSENENEAVGETAGIF